ncbi:acyltransferase ChoActase/COT/CPT [Rickenella mellea]|uniref:Acyltransferase ChoActase/COT/CPT n=1 Tax=Rickenella mellea TaxID=50990 RepID=A0A4Y7PMH2_9AGAM|nr:acyltransferase ChoActase/COT/CPT [Rickenella mellea]
MSTAAAINASQPLKWKSLAPSPPTNGVTLASQAALPHLPVPELSVTFSKLKRSLKPLAWSEEEYKVTEKKIDDFASHLAPELQDRLKKRQAETEHWLEEWWDNGAYMGYRDSVVVNVSYFYGFDDHPAHYPQTPAHRAAALTRATLLFRQKYRRGELEPEKTKEGAICMDTYRWLFDCCRIPGLDGLDWSVSHAKEGDKGDSGHVVAIRRGRVWKIDIAKDGKLLSTDDLERQFQYIYDNTTKDYPPVGVLSASNRDVWAKDYAHLSSSPQNASILNTINSSAFIVSLDNGTPSSEPAWSKALWHGGPGGVGLKDRWVDKPVQYIVYDNAKAGVMGEHSIMDGTPVARLCDTVLDALADPNFDHGTNTVSAAPTTTTMMPEPRDWLVSEQTEKAIVQAQKAAAELVDTQELEVFVTQYGKGAIKRFGFSPDSWAQLVVQLAYHRLLLSTSPNKEDYDPKSPFHTLRNGGTYEAASTRRFHKGRTEAIRVTCVESDRWVRSMVDDGVDDDERRALFGEAVKAHGRLAREAGKADGVDRHLLGLRKLLKDGEEMPAMYSDPLFLRSSNWVLSTSAIFSKHFPAYGWGEVVPEGFGVAYMTGFEDRLFFNITSRKEMPNGQFCEEIRRAAEELYALFSPKAKL